MFFFDIKGNVSASPRTVEAGYISILNNDLIFALKNFSVIDSPRAKWAITLCQILEGKVNDSPTYLGIRNFLEIDLDFLLKNEKIEYVEQVIGASEFLSEINQEVYKYIARVMLENNFYNAALKYLEKSKELFYRDPELHYLYAKYYSLHRDYEKAMFYIDECSKILPDYYPAHLFKESLEKYFA